MALNRSKVLETAQKHFAKGQYDRAIVEYQKLVDHDPSDVRTWLKIGDLHTRTGRTEDACETYARVARQYAQQGFYLKAVAVYKQILKLDPGRLDISLALADMYEQLQLISDALTAYEHVAAGYARQGDIEQALATLGRMAALDPENVPVRIKYAEALSKTGRIEEAASEFEAGASLLRDQGRMDDYVKVAERLLYHRPRDINLALHLARFYVERQEPKRALSKLQLCFKANPRDVTTLELLADAFRQLGQTPKTISVYKEIARLHQEAGQLDQRAQILSRILEIDPSDAEAQQALAASGRDSRPAQQPSSYPPQDPAPVQHAYSAPPAEAPSGRDQDDPILEVVEDDADVYLSDDEELELVEDDDLLEEPSGVSDAVEIQFEPSSSAPPANEHTFSSPEPRPSHVNPAAGAPKMAHSEPAYASSPSVPPEVAREAHIARLLTECDVFSRYGLRSKVLEQLKRVLELEPGHVEARERLKDAFLQQGMTHEAVDQLYKLAANFDGAKPQVANIYYKQILELAPGSEPALSRAIYSNAPPSRSSAPPTDAYSQPVATLLEVPEDEATDDILFIDEMGDDSGLSLTGPPPAAPTGPQFSPIAEPPSSPTTAPPAGRVSMPLIAPPTSNAPVDVVEKTELTPMSAIETGPQDFSDATLIGGGFPDLVSAPARIPSLSPPLIPSMGGEPSAPPPPEPSQSAFESSASAALERASIPPSEVEEILDEADFFIAQGLYGEAESTLKDALSAHPNHPVMLDKLSEVQASIATASSPNEGADASFLLAEKLAEELEEDEAESSAAGSDVLDVESVFAQFKKGVQEQIGLEDSDTHFDLGIAYKEMGLLEDAIQEFELARRSAAKECIAFTMVGLCHVEKGQIAEAIAQFKKGLYAENKTDREELGLYFELGIAYELLHDPAEALYYFQKVEKRSPGFRRVGERIKAMNSQAAAAPSPPKVEVDDVDRAFDDLMGDD